jgi:hypothetical protein
MPTAVDRPNLTLVADRQLQSAAEQKIGASDPNNQWNNFGANVSAPTASEVTVTTSSAQWDGFGAGTTATATPTAVEFAVSGLSGIEAPHDSRVVSGLAQVRDAAERYVAGEVAQATGYAVVMDDAVQHMVPINGGFVTVSRPEHGRGATVKVFDLAQLELLN